MKEPEPAMKTEESYILDARLHEELQDLYTKLYTKNELVVGEKLNGYYETFRNKFGPDRLLALEGEELLVAMKGGKEHDSLNYWLEFKRDDEFPSILFGSIAGGSSHKFGIFRKVDTGNWISGQPHSEKVVSQEGAIEIAREHRRQLVEGCKLLDTLPLESDDDYAVLQRTGKTELARLIPETLWQDEIPESSDKDAIDSTEVTTRKSAIPAGYTTTLVTATSEWSTHTLISSIVPVIQGDSIIYRTRHGYLTEAILRNWAITEHTTTQWEIHGRRSLLAHAGPEQQEERSYRGHWLVIDEFNRAPIDAALGEALTALSNGEALQITVDSGRVLLPLPGDFRIIGTLNSFDRNYLNLLSEALKRRFSFIEISPPSRSYRQAEQGIVMYKAIKHLAHHSPIITVNEEGIVWNGVVSLRANTDGIYEIDWLDEQHPFFHIFARQLWPLFETIRVYRQLGTAQAIALTRQLLTQGLLQGNDIEDAWQEMLDVAFCDTVADQLQVLLADELEVLSWCLKVDREQFINKYNNMLIDLRGKKRRLIAHLEALSSIVNEQGEHLLTDEDIEEVLEQEDPYVSPEVISEAFHLEQVPYRLPQFARRLRNFKAV
jgi:hypothetical protein